jgi:hypothetical protein
VHPQQELVTVGSRGTTEFQSLMAPAIRAETRFFGQNAKFLQIGGGIEFPLPFRAT